MQQLNLIVHINNGVIKMEITRKKDYVGFYELKILKENKTLTISFGRNGDLYWNLINMENLDSNNETFVINKNDQPIYDLFKKLFVKISNHKIFEATEREKLLCKNALELKKLYERDQKSNEELSEHTYFEDLCNGKYIKWHSDNEPFETGNIMTMTLDSLTGNIIINIQIISRGYDFLNICFTHSGSRYEPFSLAFYENYRELCEMDLTPISEDIEKLGKKEEPLIKKLKL